ncbi:MAG: oxaloacetate decarboxylase [Candidatus Tectimicrobiota bacterium]|nr:MAG: oxaloacetate decarboxylase [Candidatus Tectomicrobia bacterium]
MDASTRRQRLRRLLHGAQTVIVPAVFDAVSARLAEMAGFEVALLSGSVTAATLHAVPDLVLVTLTEVAQVAKRVVDATSLSLLVDADHGFGNALNVMRCVRELERAGVAALTLEDTDLPRPYGTRGPTAISIQEMCGKLRAAVAARQDPELVLIGRTDTLRYRGLEEALARAKAYAETGVDALFVAGAQRREELEALRAALPLPLIASGLPQPEDGKSGLQVLQDLGYPLTLLAAVPFRVAVQAMHEALAYLKAHGEPGPFAARMAPAALLEEVVRAAQYAAYQQRFLQDEAGL